MNTNGTNSVFILEGIRETLRSSKLSLSFDGIQREEGLRFVTLHAARNIGKGGLETAFTLLVQR